MTSESPAGAPDGSSRPGDLPAIDHFPGTGPPDAGAEPVAATAVWHRLHPLSPLVSAGPRLAAIVVVLLGIALARQRQAGGDLVSDLVIVAIVLAGGVIRWLVTRWQVADGVLRVDTGLLRRDSRRFPLSQVQAIDVVQTGLARVLGLAELRLRVAGGDASRGGRLACLRRADAEYLRVQLLAMAGAARVGAVPAAASAPSAAPASGVRHETPGHDRLIFRVRPGRLAGAVLLSRAGVVAGIVIAALITVAALTGQSAIVAPFLPIGLGAVLGTWRQFNGEFGTTVVVAEDGLHLRSGLIQTTVETIRPGRVQAVRLVEPLVWRVFGWCRLEVDVAGPRQHHENRGEAQRLRAVIPVGTRLDAEQMMGKLLEARPLPSLRAPRVAAWKAPLMYHFLGWHGDERYVVASGGRVCRKTTWVPLEKVQSVRWVQGPVQRRLGLASVHLDVAGRRVAASIRDRDDAEAGQILGRLPDLARAARSRAAR